MTVAANKMDEEVELDENTIPYNIASRLVDRHQGAAEYHKKNRNMKGYAAHMNVAGKIEDAMITAGHHMPVRSKRIEAASDKAFKEHPHPRSVTNEEVEQIDELSKKTLGSYVKKASERVAYKANHAGEIEGRGDSNITPAARATLKKLNRKTVNSLAGISRATNRLTKEEVEQIDELNKSTLGSYIKKASTDKYLKGQEIQYHNQKSLGASGAFAKETRKKHADLAGKALDKASNRETGIRRAVDRLTKEDLDEAFNAGSMKLKDGSSVNLKTEDAQAINKMFRQLSDSNRKQMESIAMSGKKGFNEILAFAKGVQD